MILFEMPNVSCPRSNRNNDRLPCWRRTSNGAAPERYKRISLRKVCRGTALRNRVWNNEKARRVTLAVCEMAREIEDMSRSYSELGHVSGIHENHPALAIDSSITIIVSI